MNILLASYENKWKNDLFRNFHYIIQILCEKYSYRLIDISRVDNDRIPIKWKDLLKENSIFDIKIKNVIYIENHNDFIITDLMPDLFESDFKKIIISDDIHKFKELKTNYYDKFDTIIINYYAPFILMYSNISISKIHWVPHGYNPEFEKMSFNKEPKKKVLLAGCIGLMYPLRKRIITYVKNNPDYKNIEVYKHPGYNGIDQRFPRVLNSYLCCITDCLTLNYIVSKYFEIPASGSLLLAKIPEGESIESLGFIDMVNFISVNENNFLERIEFVLNVDNRELIDKIRYNGYLMIRNNHSLLKRIDKINDIVSNLEN